MIIKVAFGGQWVSVCTVVFINYRMGFHSMGNNELAKQLIATYERHGWHLHSALAREENCDEFQEAFPGIKVEQAFLNALWFFRPSTSNREAWELRLLSEVPYALFETFDVDADETFKESIRAEMVHKMSERMRP